MIVIGVVKFYSYLIDLNLCVLIFRNSQHALPRFCLMDQIGEVTGLYYLNISFLWQMLLFLTGTCLYTQNVDGFK